jgi:hypothetical protein
MDIGGTHCDGMVVVHMTGVASCSSADCDLLTQGRSVTDTHEWFVSCTESLGTECPLCSEPLIGW